MCADKIHRFLMAFVLTVTMLFFAMGMVQALVIIMIVVWAFTDFCPSLWLFKKIFEPCHGDTKKD
ncbi:MAG: phosphoribosylaminoimidazole synthetase [Helicobacteraceae bacterium 4484_230]|nr:MAG: phosphoribosylaminoimidazole synthetase [Helicobacteraceae bacterium 4484_230]